MRVFVGAVALVLAAGSLGAGSGSQRYVPFTPVASDSYGVGMNKYDPRHGDIYVIVNRAGLNRVSGLVTAKDWRAMRRVNLRKSIVVAVFSDFGSGGGGDMCPKALTIQRLRVDRGQLDVKAEVKLGSACASIPEVSAAHVYSVAAVARGSMGKVPTPRHLWFTFTDS